MHQTSKLQLALLGLLHATLSEEQLDNPKEYVGLAYKFRNRSAKGVKQSTIA
jgi:hypothetical protein